MNYFGTNYQPNYQPQPPYQPTYTNGGNLYFVGSEDEAKNWIVNPNQSVYLLDRNNAKLYIKTVEKNGMVQPLEVFTLGTQNPTEDKVEYATKEDLERLQNKFRSELRKVKPIGKKNE